MRFKKLRKNNTESKLPKGLCVAHIAPLSPNNRPDYVIWGRPEGRGGGEGAATSHSRLSERAAKSHETLVRVLSFRHTA